MKKNNGKSTLCGGTIVASRYIISAAHCFFQKEIVRSRRKQIIVKKYQDHPEDVLLHIGYHDKRNPSVTGKEITLRGESLKH